jgi:hypothetical protein
MPPRKRKADLLSAAEQHQLRRSPWNKAQGSQPETSVIGDPSTEDNKLCVQCAGLNLTEIFASRNHGPKGTLVAVYELPDDKKHIHCILCRMFHTRRAVNYLREKSLDINGVPTRKAYLRAFSANSVLAQIDDLEHPQLQDETLLGVFDFDADYGT